MNSFLGMKTFLIAGTLLLFSGQAFAEETNLEKLETQKNQVTDTVKKGYRNTKAKGCEMINGKMQCLGKRISNRASDLSDRAKTKSKEIENQVD